MNEKKNRNERKTLPFPWEYGQEEITLKVSSYAYGNGLAILMYRQEEGELELFDDLTVNLPGYGLKPQEAFVSGDFCRDKLAFIQRTGWERCCRIKPVRVATYTPVAFDLQDSLDLDRRVEEFCEQWELDVPKKPEKIQGKPVGRKKRERGR